MKKGNFTQQVYQLVRKIPQGRVMTYGQIAFLAGQPKAARVVGNILHQNPDPKDIPCHRVVSKNGEVGRNYRFGGWKEQKRKLKKEGIEFKDERHVNLEKFLISNV